MYAIIATGGKQYNVAPNKEIIVESLEAKVGDTVSLDKVLLLVADDGNVTTASNELASAAVEAEVIEHGRHKKIKILKFKRRKHHMKRMGHRQNYTKLKIKAINT